MLADIKKNTAESGGDGGDDIDEGDGADGEDESDDDEGPPPLENAPAAAT